MNEKEVNDEKLLLNKKKLDGRIGEGQEDVEKEVEKEEEKVIEVKGRGPLKVRTNTNPLLVSHVLCCICMSCLILFHCCSILLLSLVFA